MTKFYESFINLCKERGVAPNTAAKEIGIPSGSITSWKNGTMPRKNNIDRLAAYFGVSVDSLLGYENGDNRNWAILSAEEEMLISWYRSLPAEKRELVLRFKDIV